MDLVGVYATSLWLGILTSINPCPLASNVAAVSFLAGSAGAKKKSAFTSGLSYGIGRSAAYTALVFIITWNLLQVPSVARFLSLYMNKFIGPLLIVVGLVMLEILRFPSMSLGSMDLASKARKMGGLVGPFLMGALFALSFCPISAAIFFGSLIPLSLSEKSPLILPLFYGMGTALPVIAAGLGISIGVDVTGKLFKQVQRFDFWARRVTGAVLILVGVYYLHNYY